MRNKRKEFPGGTLDMTMDGPAEKLRMKKDKRVMVSLRLEPELHQEFKIACVLNKTNAQSLLVEKVKEFVEEMREKHVTPLKCSR